MNCRSFQLHTSCLPSLPSNQSVCQFGPLEPIFLPPPCISIPRTQLAQNNAVPIKGNSKGLPHHALLHRKFKPKNVIECFPSQPISLNINLKRNFTKAHSPCVLMCFPLYVARID